MSVSTQELRNRERRAYSPGEVAEALGCTRQHVHNMIQRGEIASFKLGARRFIPAQVLDDLEMQAFGGGE